MTELLLDEPVDVAPRRRRHAAVLTAATLNVHAGQATPAVPRFMRRHRVDVASLQEVRSLDRLEDLLEDFAPGRYGLSPDDGVIGTAIVWDKRRLRFIDDSNALITAGRGDGAPRLGWTPERRLTLARFEDRATGRRVVQFAWHTWAIGDGADWKREGHVEQVEAFARATAHRGDESVVIGAGDLNEHLAGLGGPRSARRQLAAVGMEPSFALAGVKPKPTQRRGPLVLDGVFWRDDDHLSGVTHGRRRIGDGADHWAVVSSAYVQPLT